MTFRHGFFTAVALAAAVACGATPSTTPLTPSSPRNMARVRPSSSRAPETDEPESQEVELNVSDDDDDGDGDKNSVSSHRAAANSSSSALSTPSPSSASCTTAAGSPPDCASLNGGRSCLGATLAQKACRSVGPALDPRIGAEWISCMQAPGTERALCDSRRIVDCGLKAVADACIDGSYHDLCAGIANDCADMAPEITGTVCEELIGAWKPEARGKIIACLKQGCSTGGFGACLP